LHFAEKSEVFVSDTINCGVYLFSKIALEMDVYKEFGEKYRSILSIAKDEGQGKSLSSFFNEFANDFKIKNCTSTI